MIIANLNNIDLRQDKEALWQIFLVSERMKFLQGQQLIANSFFWRTTQQQEIDYVEEKNGTLAAYEFQWQADGRKKTPAVFLNYGVKVEVVSKDNFRGFVAM